LRWLTHEPEIPVDEIKVGDVMTGDVITLDPEADHADAARLMEKARIKRIPIVEDDVLVGIVSRSDIMRAFVRPDVEIVRELESHVIRKVLWIDPNSVRITCEDGNLTLSGQLETRSDAELLAELAKRLDGVVSVKSKMTWSIDNTKLEMAFPPSPARPYR
jgi:predicted transcriptional regulator